MTEGPNSPQTPPDPQQVTPPILGEPPRTGMSGCAKAAIIGGAVILVAIVALVAVVLLGIGRFVGDVEEALTEEPCEYITDQEASEIIGVPVEAVSGEGGMAAILGVIRDTRVLGWAPSCFIGNDDGTIQLWVSVYDGRDAAAVFASEEDVADGQIVSQTTTETGSIQVETVAFRGEDVPGLGEEAFCTEVGVGGYGGVLARTDDRVVYVSVLALVESQGSEVFDDSLCQRGIPVAMALLD
jgi:hypothetical protein